MTEQTFCALCGNAIAGEGQFVIEGTACSDCFKKREQARARKLMPLALFALLSAIVPFLVEYSTTKMHSKNAATVTTRTRFLIFSSASSDGFDAHIEGADPGPVVRSYSDPVAIAFGGAAVALGALGAFLALKRSNRRSLMLAAAAALIGVWHVIRGAGVA
jgi:peptidoglycan/LPS O-acetylase OafA/YrhL